MAANPPEKSSSHIRPKHRQEHIPLSKVLESISGDNSEVEDLIDDTVEDVDYHPPQQEPSSSEKESSGSEDPIPQSSRGRKRLYGETFGYRSDRSTAILRTPRRQTPRDETCGSNDDTEESTPAPSFQEQSKQERGVRWRPAQLTSNLDQFEEEAERNREGWTTLDYVNQYIDTDVMNLIACCSNATAIARSGHPLNTSVEEIYHFFGASMSMIVNDTSYKSLSLSTTSANEAKSCWHEKLCLCFSGRRRSRL
ncbi:uncharacterized protein LOC130436411 [Triplophysa dalaica]|uniref:uncharacterized protein LOC130436411 n=1 Tax=Triplophysa dalaica TaxID=1582913 RepID=UPI0024E00CAB|nr:uncharacterized protein LOC130436411 [Triplophysa dalaica]